MKDVQHDSRRTRKKNLSQSGWLSETQMAISLVAFEPILLPREDR
jgi:hypothetical protein